MSSEEKNSLPRNSMMKIEKNQSRHLLLVCKRGRDLYVNMKKEKTYHDSSILKR